MTNLTARDRLLMALQHKEPDCIPYDLAGTSVTGIHYVAYQNLVDYLGKDYLLENEQESWCYEKQQGLAQVDEEIKQKLKVDTRGTKFKNPSTWKLEIKEVEGKEAFTDELGCRWISSRNGYYFDQISGKSHPLGGSITVEDIKNYPWPNASDPVRVENLRNQLKGLREAGYAAIIEAPFNGVFSLGFRMRGYSYFYEDLGARQSLAYSLMDRLTDLKIDFWDMALEEISDLVDVIVELDDLGGQNGTLISPEMYRKLVKPRHRKLFSFIKKKAPNSYLFLHSDGSLCDIIPDLIELGVDILNPVQVSAAKMDSAKLKRKFGDSLSFWGGGVDTQNILGKGTPGEVRSEVKRRIDDLAPGGGYIFAAIHNIQADVPPENFMAMWETLQQYKSY
ncbi:uroporphyrinogen-III decarboxylase [Candidatus Aerophobetes bacterium]|uniref:Uroporphyrinogen-III decarboxylase n=1 Tax=Aerophobetes bacterium TaxID=2030807 RepID=A0A523WB61_UNCAE|nr:MAG: uroporphyrinogen-III decarboxylase [Candidatus Aerophobetes bacterium]